MLKNTIDYVRQFFYDTEYTNKLLVTLFLTSKNITEIKNYHIRKLILPANDEQFYALFNRFKSEANSFDFGDLINLFELAIPPVDKKTHGIVYTPKFIKEFIINKTFYQTLRPIADIKVCDPACGCGGFLYSAAKELKRKTGKSCKEIFASNIYGIDIVPYSSERTMILLTLYAIVTGEDEEEFQFNIFCNDSLAFDWFQEVPEIYDNGGFDIIIGNPPYVVKRNMNDSTKELVKKWFVTQVGNTDLYLAFFEIAIKFLKDGGVMGYITVNNFIKSLNARNLRKLLSDLKPELAIYDFKHEQLFQGMSTYTCIAIMRKSHSEIIRYGLICSDSIINNEEIDLSCLPYNNLDNKDGWNLNKPTVIDRIHFLENRGERIGDSYEIRTGVATLRNDIYIFTPENEDETYYYRRYKEQIYKIEKKLCRDIINPNKIKSDNLALYIEKIIYPYRLVSDSVVIMEENDIVSNFPEGYQFLLTNKESLSKRDKGKKTYPKWYAFGRTQSLNNRGFRLLFPHITSKPKFFISTNQELLFYNGHAFLSQSLDELLNLKKSLESDDFLFYIQNSSRPYSGTCYSLSKNYIKNFSI